MSHRFSLQRPSFWRLAPRRPSRSRTPASEPEIQCETQEYDRPSQRFKCVGHVEFDDGDMKLYADELEWFQNEDRVVAIGNVVFIQGNNQIAADRAEFNTETRLGTFYTARGVAPIQPVRTYRAAAGRIHPASADPRGHRRALLRRIIEKVGPRKYKIRNGGFTTCLQPTPRWNFDADTITLNIDDYTLLRNAIFNVKGVPLLYLPILYYPTKKEDRATGFLLPTYGVTRLRGQAISQRVLLGHRPQPGCDVHARLVLEDRPGLRRRVPLRARQSGSAIDRSLPPAATTKRPIRPACCPRRTSFHIRGSGNQMLARAARVERSRGLPDEHRRPRRRSPPTSTTSRAISGPTAATSSGPGATTR